jgi:hypothetical protein
MYLSEQPAGRTTSYTAYVEQLNILQREYEEVERKLAFALDIEDLHVQIDRRDSILVEARKLAQSLNISGDHWFSASR